MRCVSPMEETIARRTRAGGKGKRVRVALVCNECQRAVHARHDVSEPGVSGGHVPGMRAGGEKGKSRGRETSHLRKEKRARNGGGGRCSSVSRT